MSDEKSDAALSPVNITPVSPGAFLYDRIIAPRKLSLEEFGNIVGLAGKTIGGIVNCRKKVTSDTAFRLEMVTGVTQKQWLTMQMNYDIWLQKQKPPRKKK